jgi:multiple sugar transport system substrate-binding protein
MKPWSSSADVSRRAAIGTLAAAAGGFALFGPRGRKEVTGSRVVLDYWEKWTGHEGAAMERVVQAFNESQNRIFVRYFATAGIDQKTLIAVAGGNPPDVVGLWTFNIPVYAETGAILPLDEPASPLLDVNRLAPAVRPLVTHLDHTGRPRTWAAVNTCGTVALYYNRAAFRDAELDPDRPPRTMSEMDAAMMRLERANSRGQIECAGFIHTEPGWWQWIWPSMYGGSLYDPATDTATADDPRCVAAFEWAARTSTRLGVDAVKAFRSGFANAYASSLNGFLDGKVAMVVQGPWLANVIQAHKPDLDYGVAPFPVDDSIFNPASPMGLVECDVLAIPRGCKHPEASREFVEFTQREEHIEFLGRAHCKNSPLAVVSPSFFDGHANRGIGVHQAIAMSPRAFRFPQTRVWLQYKDELDASFQRIWGLERDPASELAAVRGKAQRMLDHAEAQRRARGYGRA